ncbi:hypothetical protein CVS47_02774 [Microbacterium lemovicicum]|uniref:DUF916 domain-containing protein n=1 Tax=Microbacterium lemovicicum TaxID=1072463 RepID=A0A3Q9J4D2_9MICO|nr:hypothetical protein [Microbacterium lemovicicum]AZS38123.1 hypothetical protein CVS47_02774 [Microbacterium lemovicicum]
MNARPRTLLVLAAVVAACLSAAPAAASGAQPASPSAWSGEAAPTPAGGTTWALQPATADGPDGRVSLRHVIDGGAQASDAIALTNFSAQPATFAVYASDGTISSSGGFDLVPADQAPSDGGSWVALGDVAGSTPRDGGGMLLPLEAGATALIPIEISVPGNATPGDHPAGVVAEFVPANGSNVQLASRVGVRMHLRVSGDVVAAVVPEAVQTAVTPSWNPFEPSMVTVTYALANAGNVRLGAETETALQGPLGAGAAREVSSQREVLPGQATTATVTVPVAPLFFAWGEVRSAPVVVGEDSVEAELASASTAFTVWTVPWSQLVLLLLIVGGFFGWRAVRRRSGARVQARIDAAVAAATAATIPSGTSAAEESVAPADVAASVGEDRVGAS